MWLFVTLPSRPKIYYFADLDTGLLTTYLENKRICGSIKHRDEISKFAIEGYNVFGRLRTIGNQQIHNKKDKKCLIHDLGVINMMFNSSTVTSQIDVFKHMSQHTLLWRKTITKENLLCVRACQKYLRYWERFCDVFQSPCCIFSLIKNKTIKLLIKSFDFMENIWTEPILMF